MEKPDFKIKTDRGSSNFSDHLNQIDNHRIIFSAPFGTGKTSFLKDYFERHKSEYQVFHLFPINYSVASNEDIFELIKYDILFNFLRLDVEFEKVSIPKSISFGFFLQNNPENIIMPFVRQIPVIGKQVAEIAKEIIQLYKTFEIQHKGNQSDQEKTIIKYLEEINKTKGSVKEEDFYTQLICQLSTQIKEKDSKKKTVLIIDDLDRIDPDHIFRILNVFSAHFDHDSSENKFDFDKIILVCDINNIRKIYSNRYGQDVDFSGYIDKFYSEGTFHFDLLPELEDKLSEVFLTVILTTTNERDRLYSLKDHIDIRYILYLIFAFHKSGYLPIRKLLKIFSKQIIIKERRSGPRINGRYVSVYDLRFLIVYQSLKSIISDFEEFKLRLNDMKENIENNPYSDYKVDYLHALIPILSYPDHLWKLEINKEINGIVGIEDFKIEWSIIPKEKNRHSGTSISFETTCKILKNGNELAPETANLFILTKKAIEIIERYNLNWIA
ncbi:P-loop NTPase fold protein [Algoriphagus yeomjeoni]|uniref:KAP-like P-loop domain-containing protein n=1 Tax=Algoriphagus yeomjeoni TaxID=291403 RepID=A0A327PGZ9_9BACT|nr:P-loop NTPase fold protein [Algoriphagus yeomjeoni]RAI91488.1 KAP-like P-loop domain-containing protein [Algoriphagus yeomjeoni]